MPQKLSREQIEEMAEKWANGTISLSEKKEFIDWFNEYGEKELRLAVDPQSVEPELKTEMWNAIQSQIAKENKKSIRLWPRVAVASAVALAVVISGYFIFKDKPEQPVAIKVAPIPKDINPPATNRAMITLTDGRTIYLDSVNNGSLATVSNVQISKTADGQISYKLQDADSRGGEIVYNTLSNPRGSTVIDITLADGTRVWLNSGSSLHYPVSFVGDERKVSITGEAYFEVAHDATKPFKVSKDETEITVLGTHFNVNAYDDESDIRVTLLEGSVKVRSGVNSQESIVISPGQQAIASSLSPLIINYSPNIDQVMTWKNGLFDFEGEKLNDVMRQLSRWYDIKVEFQGTIPEKHYFGSIRRQVNLSEVLKMLELAGNIEFHIDGKRVFIKGLP